VDLRRLLFRRQPGRSANSLHRPILIFHRLVVAACPARCNTLFINTNIICIFTNPKRQVSLPGNMMLSQLSSHWFAVLFIAAGSLLFSAASDAVTVAFGSYTRESYAMATAEAVAHTFGIETRLIPVVVAGTRYLRVVGPPGLTTEEARRLLERVHSNGFESAWFLAEDASGATPAVVATPPPADEPATAAPPLPSAAPTDTAAVAPAAAVGAGLAASGTPSTTPPGFEPQAAPERLLLTHTELDDGAAIEVPKFSEAAIDFKLDGVLSESVWGGVEGYDGMRVLVPDTLEVPRHKTLMRYFYTEKGLYIGMHAEQPPDTLMERLSSRDNFFSRDSVSVTLDTSGTGIYGYWFSVSLGDSLSDGKVAPERQYSREWDGPWDGRTSTTEDGWTAEMFLPWSMMAMPGTTDDRLIGLYVSRQVGYLDERFGFPALPETGARFMSALQPMTFDDVEPKRQLDFYPYVSGNHDFATDDSEANVGVDVFWRPSTNLQMSATVNPDFGAVESDDVVINLTATETFFPEKRLFFLEGNEIFETTPRSRPQVQGSRTTSSRLTTQLFTPEPTQVVNTRRIGGAPTVTVPDGVTVPGVELSKPSDLLGALKATGQISGLRYGFLGAVEDDMDLPGTDEDGNEVSVDTVGRDFGVARVLYENVGASRQSIGYIGTYTKNEFYDAIVHGVDGHYLNRTGKLQLDLQLLASDVDTVQGYGGMLDARYTQRQGMVHQLRLDAQDDELDINDLGFLRRNDNYGGFYAFNYSRSKGLERLRNFNLNLSTSYWENGAGEVTRTGAFWRNTFTFKNFFELRTELDYFPRRWDDLESEGNGSYRVDDRWIADVAFGTDATKVLSLSGRLGVRQEELSGWSTRSAIGFTYKPNHRFSLDLDLNYQDRDGWLLHRTGQEFTTYAAQDFHTYAAQDFQPRMAMDLFISARQQLRMTLQWAAIKAKEQERWLLPEDGDGYLIPVEPDPDSSPRDFVINRMTVQLRYRWQIAPLSDLFVVYTRGSNVPDNTIDDGIDDLFYDALTDPVLDFFVVKLRYRFGM
jgi:hypothetical protein